MNNLYYSSDTHNTKDTKKIICGLKQDKFEIVKLSYPETDSTFTLHIAKGKPWTEVFRKLTNFIAVWISVKIGNDL